MKKSSTNMFINMIYGKKKKSVFGFLGYLLYKRKVNKFRNKILEISPSFEVLWEMSNFIKLAEEIFFYDNNVDGSLYSSRSYRDGENGFKINDICTVIVKLYEDKKRVNLEIKHNNGVELLSRYSFKDSEWTTDPTIYDEMVLEQIIKIINKHIIDLFDMCYRAR